MNILKEMRETEKRTPVPIFISDKCLSEDKCGKCNKACPIPRLGVVKSIRNEPVRITCIKCQACMTVCPTQAITVGDKPPLDPMSKNPLSYEQLIAALEERRSARDFKSKKISEEDLGKLIRSVRCSPIGHNHSYIGMVIVEREDLLKELSRVCMESWGWMTRFINRPVFNLLFKKMLGKRTYSLFSELAKYYKEEKEYYEAGGDPILFNGSVILITAPAGEKMGMYEAGLATMHLMLCAETLGLGTCLSGILMAMQDKVKKVLGLPKDIDICGAVIIGHPDIKRYGVPHRKERPVLRM